MRALTDCRHPVRHQRPEDTHRFFREESEVIWARARPRLLPFRLRVTTSPFSIRLMTRSPFAAVLSDLRQPGRQRVEAARRAQGQGHREAGAFWPRSLAANSREADSAPQVAELDWTRFTSNVEAVDAIYMDGGSLLILVTGFVCAAASGLSGGGSAFAVRPRPRQRRVRVTLTRLTGDVPAGSSGRRILCPLVPFAPHAPPLRRPAARLAVRKLRRLTRRASHAAALRGVSRRRSLALLLLAQPLRR